jgi:hypothetical protein
MELPEQIKESCDETQASVDTRDIRGERQEEICCR